MQTIVLRIAAATLLVACTLPAGVAQSTTPTPVPPQGGPTTSTVPVPTCPTRTGCGQQSGWLHLL